MSLVNDMLRDLDKRKRLPPQAARVIGVMENSRRVPRFDPRWLAGIAVVGVLAGLAGGYWLFRQTPLPGDAIDVANTDAPITAPQPAPVEVAVNTNNVMDIVQESAGEGGFSLRIKAAQPVQFNIVSRDTYGITLHLDGVNNYSGKPANLTGMSVLLESSGANIEIDLDVATDFSVFEDAETPGFDVVLQANYRQPSIASMTNVAADVEFPATVSVEPSPSQALVEEIPAAPAAPSQSTASANSDQGNAVRVTRELTLEQRDAIASRAAIALMQGGQLQQAQRDLQNFVRDNTEAHQARATLATLQLAQQEIAAADATVSEGLAKAPNFSPYKKIKARLLMQQGNAATALTLLRDVPPPVSEDAEYHEILASLYQQNGQHPSAISTYQELLRHDAKQGRWWMGMAVSLEAQGNQKDALGSFQAALQNGNLDASLRQYSQSRIRALNGALQ